MGPFIVALSLFLLGLGPAYEARGAAVLRFHFFESDGATSFRDSSGNGNNGTCSNCPTILGGKFERAARFDGTNDSISVSDSNSLDFGTGDFSASVWVRFNALSVKNVIFDKRVNADLGYVLMTDVTNSDRLMFIRGWGSADGVTSNASLLSTGRWIHIGIVVDTSGTDEVTFYIDGKAQGSGNLAAHSATNAQALVLGFKSDAASGATYLNGKLSDFALYNTALTRSEMEYLYLSSRDSMSNFQ